MLWSTLSASSNNWPLFLLSSLIVCVRAYIPSICLWILRRFEGPSKTIDSLTHELKQVTRELAGLSRQEEFASYTRKERQRNALIQRLKDERTLVETKHSQSLIRLRVVLNIGIVVLLILMTFTGRQDDTRPILHFSFCRFPTIMWIVALNTFVSHLADILVRYRTKIENKNSSE